MKIYYVACSLNKHGFYFRLLEIAVKESNLCFITTKKKRIKKESLLKPDVFIKINHCNIQYYAYCLESDIDKAKEMLKEEVLKTYHQIKEEFEVIVQVVKQTSADIKYIETKTKLLE